MPETSHHDASAGAIASGVTATSLAKLLAPALIALLVVYAPILYDLVRDWMTDSNYSHGFFIPLISGYLLWKKREALPVAVDPRGSPFGLAIIAVAMLLLLGGVSAAEYFTARVSFVLALAGIVMYYAGTRFFRLCWFEITFLLFMIPIPYVIYYAVTFPLQLFATKVSMRALLLLGVPAVREGNIIHLQGISLEVAEACSGIRSMVSLVALGAMWAYIAHRSFLSRALIFLSTAPIAVATNVLRIIVTAVLAHVGRVFVTEEPLHSVMGIIVFVMAFIGFFALSTIITRVFRIP